MKQQVLKALANPARIFYVPYTLAVMNFAVLFIIYIAVAVAQMILSGGNDFTDPLYFLVILIITHAIWASFSKKDPQLGQIIAAKLQMLKNKIPGRLAA
ncbi:MAG: VirB3 family type IV secretion system protein [Muribaculaceae bacterium]|nr:VirB3 family type IV secretion system protein [Muribaculaceae bacterium]